MFGCGYYLLCRISFQIKNEAFFIQLFNMVFDFIPQVKRVAEDRSQDNEYKGCACACVNCRGRVPESWENEEDDDAEEQTVERGFDNVGNILPRLGQGERFAHSFFFGGTAVLELALFDERVARLKLFLTKSF